MQDVLLLFVTVPLVTAFVGWVTNWAAVKMIFHPERFIGIGPIGWQGILVRRSDKFATGVADMVTDNLISARELAERFDPGEMEQLFGDTLDAETRAICREAADVIQPGAWDLLPDDVRERAVAQVRDKSAETTREIFGKLQDLSENLLDLHALVYRQLSGQNVRRLVRLTQEIGGKEFKFIEYYGGIFGFVIGLVQIAVWQVMQIWWLMPVVGLVVGLVTNWLAIQMIFRPQEPTTYAGLVTYQGLFAKRQAEIAADYGRVAADEILTPRTFIRVLSEGEAGQRIAELVTGTISERIDREWQRAKDVVPIRVTPEQLAEVKEAVVHRIVTTVPDIQPTIEEYVERKLDVGRTVESRLASLPKSDFERVLRGIFEEDEITLIAVGGGLGAGVGFLQALLVLMI